MSSTTHSNFDVKEENKKKLLKFLGVDMYENEFSAVDEFFTNARTAVKKADMFFDDVEKHVLIEISEVEDGIRFTIRDTGIGIDEDTIDTLESITESDTSNYEQLTGTFGTGFYSGLKFVSIEGCFYMRSRSRRTDELITGRWDAHGFDDSADCTGLFDEEWDTDTYGTEFRMIAKDIDGEEVFDYTTNLIKYVDVPVTARYVNENGEKTEKEFCDTSVTEKYSGGEPVTSFDFDDFTLHIDSDAEGDAYLNKIPIEISQGINADWPHLSVDLEMFIEERKVFRGPHKGQLIFESENFVHDELESDEYILETQLSEDDIEYPYPSGTREVLHVPDSFAQFIETLIEDTIKYAFSSYSGRLTDADSAYEKAESFTWDDLQLIYSSIDFLSYRDAAKERLIEYKYLQNELTDWIAEDSITEGLLELAQVLKTDVERKTHNNKSFGGRFNTREKEVGKVIHKAPNNPVPIYVSVTKNELKMNAAIDIDKRHIIALNLENSRYYDVMTQFENIKRLSTIKKSDIEQKEDLSTVTEKLFDKQYENLSIAKQKEEENVVVRFEEETEKPSVSELEREIVNSASDEVTIEEHTVEKVIVFTEHSQSTIFDYTGMKNNSVALVRIDAKYADELLTSDTVYTIDEVVENDNNVSVYKCPDNKYESVQKITGLSNIDVCIVIPDELGQERIELIGRFAPSFYDTHDINEIESLHEYSFGGKENTTYGIVTKSEFVDGFGAYPELETVYSFTSDSVVPVEHRTSNGSQLTDTKLLLFKKMIEKDEFTNAHKYCLETATKPLDSGGKELVLELFN